MHLMYTLDENGNRLYTLTVRLFIVCLGLESHPLMVLQKMTPEGRITKSAHPGTFQPWIFRRSASKDHAQLVSPRMTSFLATVSLSKSATAFCPPNCPLSPCKLAGHRNLQALGG